MWEANERSGDNERYGYANERKKNENKDVNETYSRIITTLMLQKHIGQ